MDNRLALMCGIDLLIPELKITLHQPTIKEIAYMGETEFFKALQLLLVNKDFFSQDKTFLENTTNFQIFMMMMEDKKIIDLKENVINLFSLILPSYKVAFTPSSIIFTNQEKTTFFVDANSFDFIQKYLKIIFCIKEDNKNDFNPANEKAKEIAEKIMRGRKRAAAEKGENNKGSIFSQYLSTLTIGVSSMTLKEAMELTVYQLYDLVERYQLYINWDIDIRSRMAGAKMDSPPDNWMKNIH